MSLPYRKDIDGLRAIAVLLVITFHVYPHTEKGGFIGVDIFFVISGFLITQLIYTGLHDQEFSLLDFYARRIRRIFPALVLVLTVCMLAGWMLLFPADYQNVGKHVAASASFVANFTLWQEAGYFDTPSELKPLLHLWSLGIEEQFYIFWPTLMLLTWRWRRGPVILACAIFAGSFVCNLVVSGSDAATAFFLPMTRSWELMMGCLLALTLPPGGLHDLALTRSNRHAALICDSVSLIGGLLIVLAVLLVTGERPFPGWWALLPTVGVALLIAAGPSAVVNVRLLSLSPLVKLGLISYPLYLWHWPMLAFLREYRLRAPTDLMRWAAIALAIALAAWTYQFVEKPIRRGAPVASKLIAAAVAMLLVGSSGLTVFAEAGYPQRFPKEVAGLFERQGDVAKVFQGSGLCVRAVHDEEFEFTRDCDRAPHSDVSQIVVWGDSHGSNLIRGLLELEATQRKIRTVFFTTPGCPPNPLYTNSRPVLATCPPSNEIAMERIAKMKPDVVILAGNWERYDGATNASLVNEQSIRDTVEHLHAMGVSRVVGVGQFPLWTVAVPKILARYYRDGGSSSVAVRSGSAVRNAAYVDPVTFEADRRMRQWFASAGATFVSPLSTLCDLSGCLLTVPGRTEPMDGDGDHLTYAGSIWFVAENARRFLQEH